MPQKEKIPKPQCSEITKSKDKHQCSNNALDNSIELYGKLVCFKHKPDEKNVEPTKTTKSTKANNSTKSANSAKTTNTNKGTKKVKSSQREPPKPKSEPKVRIPCSIKRKDGGECRNNAQKDSRELYNVDACGIHLTLLRKANQMVADVDEDKETVEVLTVSNEPEGSNVPTVDLSIDD